MTVRRRQPFCEQSVQFFLRPGKTWQGALFDGRQSRLDHFLERSVTATAYHRLNSPLLLRCQMNGHGFFASRYSHVALATLRVGKNLLSRKYIKPTYSLPNGHETFV
jgi:hypothetical protein